MPPGDLILLTGSTGHIGFTTLLHALEAGYAVRAVVRSEAKRQKVLSRPALRAVDPGECLTFVVIPDFTGPTAFGEAMHGVRFVVHCASPMPFSAPTTDDVGGEFIKPAVEAILNVLRAAKKEGGVRRVIITSSPSALAPVSAAFAPTDETFTACSRQPDPEGPWPAGTPSFVAYAGSKVAALNAAESWMKDNSPEFSLVHLMPAFVIGRNGMCDSVTELRTGPNNMVLDIVAGSSQAGPGMPAAAVVVTHVDDCARIHVEALEIDLQDATEKSFVISYDWRLGTQWNDAKAIVQRRFPDAVRDGKLPCSGSLESVMLKLEGGETERVFGLEHTYEDAVISIVEQYLELLEKERGMEETWVEANL